MKTFRLFSQLLILLFVLISTACIQNKSDISANNLSFGDFSASQLNLPPRGNWPTNGGSINNQRWSPLKQINRSNVDQVKGLWRTHLNGSGMEARNSGEAQILVHNGVMFTVTGSNDVFAVSIESGEIVWSYTADLPQNLGQSICCGWSSRGLGMGGGLVFMAQLDSKIVALDEKTGELVWQTQGMSWQEGYSISSAPLYYDGMLISGFSGGEYGVRGLVKAFDAATGEEIWAFYTVPEPGAFGHETWPQNNEAWRHGGGAVWQTPAVDPDLNLLYFSTGNPGPDYNGSTRAGDNLFTNSIVALDVNTGEYRWHFQEVHHDIWDYDAANPVILFDINLAGESRKALAQAGKTGWVYLLDRVTGEPLLGIDERDVLQEKSQATSLTQPYVVGDSFVPQFVKNAPDSVELVNQGRIFTPFGPDKAIMVQPSPSGSANWAPSSLDPNRNIMYICAAETAMSLIRDASTLSIPDELNGRLYLGGGYSTGGRSQSGVIAAMDMETNLLVWQHHWPDTCYSGFVSTAGNLLFVGRNDGRLTALDIETGDQLWEFQTGAGMNTTVSIFEQDGEQFIAAYSAGNFFAGSYHGDSLWLFSLQGIMEETVEGDTTMRPAL